MKTSPFADLLCRIFSGSPAEYPTERQQETSPRSRATRHQSRAQESRGPSGSQALASRRAAFAHPRALATTLVMAVLLSAWWVAAQGTKKAPTKAASSGSVSNKEISSNDLEGIVRAAAERERQASSSGLSAKRFALTEGNLTPSTQSDELQPSYSPTGAFIVFKSNGIDANGDGRLDATGFSADGKYHIWLMNRDGSGQRKLTGLPGVSFSGAGFDQDHPAFSPDGNFIVFAANGLRKATNADGVVVEDTTQTGNLFVLTLRDLTVEQITNFQTPGAQINGPNWGGSTSSIAFSHNSNIDNDALDTSGNFDIFLISQSGQNLRRLTGGAQEANAADRTASNFNPAFSLITPSTQIYFSSNRTNSSGNNARRIWLMNGDGNLKRQITDPTVRTAGAATDNDDYPAPSLNQGSFQERVGFQSDSLIDATDNTRDLNVWSVGFSTQATPTPVPTNTPLPPPPPSLNVTNFGNLANPPSGGGEVKSFGLNGNPLGTFVDTNPAGGTTFNQLEGIVYGSDANGDGYPELFVSIRNANKVNRYDGRTGQPFGIGGNPTDATFFTGANTLKLPTGLAFSNGFVFVGSGTNGPITANAPLSSTNTVKAFNAVTGAPFPNKPANGDFFGAGAGGITNGIEGVSFDAAGNLYVSAFFDNKVVQFDNTGTLLNANFASGNGLSGPTGNTIGPDGNLYVSDSTNNRILRFDGTTGAFIDIYVTGNGLNAPEGLIFGPDANLYVNNFSAGAGDRVLRFSGPNAATPGAPLPAPNRAGAIFATGVNGPSYLTFNPSATDPTILNPPQPTATPIPPPPVIPEIAGNIAQLESNRISSPGGFHGQSLACNGCFGCGFGSGCRR